MNLQTMSTWSTTKFTGRLYGGIVACAYLFVVGLAEIWRVAAEPHLKFILYSLALLALFLQAAFDTQEKVRRLCLALTLVPLTRLLGFAMPASLFPLQGQYLLLAVALLVAAGLVIRNLALQPEQIGLGLGHGPFGGHGPLGLVGYVPLMLIAVPLGLVKYVLLQSALPNDLLALPMLSPLVVAAVSLCVGLVETLIFYSIVLHISRDLLGERASSLYVALLVGALYLGHAPWPGDLFVFVVSLLYSWVVLKTHTIYAVALSHVFVAYVLLIAPLLMAR
jgi:membrane protease YdiL (CAAX protease family)